MINAIIIDDSVEAIEQLEKTINFFFKKEITVIKSFTSPLEALKDISEYNPDVVFLDLEMPELDGFDTYTMFPKDFKSEVIVYSGRNDFGVKVINNLNVLGFISKPIILSELRKCIDKLNQKLHLQPVQESNFKNDILIINGQSKTLFLKMESIIRVESSGAYSNVYYDNTFVYTSRNLKYFENALNPDIFIRLDRQNILNIHYVKEIIKNNYSSILVLADDFKIKLSKEKVTEFMSKMNNVNI